MNLISRPISSNLPRLLQGHYCCGKSLASTKTMASPLTIHTRCRMNSGYEMPILGFGVYQIQVADCPRLVQKALEIGYAHIDSAISYRNEKGCAEGIRSSGFSREDVFLTTKIPPKQMGYEKTKAAIESSLKNAELDYFDLVLIHSPYGGKEARIGAWSALVEAQRAGQVRSIGVSNYGVHHLDELEEHINNGGGGKIDVGQYELHPWLQRPDIVSWLQKRNVVIQAYSPLTRTQRLDELVLKELSKKHGKTPAQVLLRWSLQKGFVPLPKTAFETRIQENADVFDFELSKQDMDALHTEEYSPVTWDPTVDRS